MLRLLCLSLLLAPTCFGAQSFLRSDDAAGSSGATGEDDAKTASDYFKPDLVKRNTLASHVAQNPEGEIESGVTAKTEDPKKAKIGRLPGDSGASGAGPEEDSKPAAAAAGGPSGASSDNKDCGSSGASGSGNSAHIAIVKSVDTSGGFATPEDALLRSQKKEV
eukprot:g4236.t1